jgi:hypothetical protein
MIYIINKLLKQQTMKNQFAIFTLSIIIFLLVCSISASDKTNQTPTDATDIHDDPVKVVEAIFEAARTGDYSQLSGLCDPTGSGDGDTKRICSIDSQPKEIQDEFKKYFQNGKVVGSAEINGNEAKVKIKFGPKGNKDEVFNLVKISGKWYISSF